MSVNPGQAHPSYGSLMYLRHVWVDADKVLRDWIVRQFAAMLLYGPRPVAESGEYGLWVGYFETPSDAPEVFTGLTAELPHSFWPRLLSAAGPVSWAVKRGRFFEAVEIPALHAALAAGVAHRERHSTCPARLLMPLAKAQSACWFHTLYSLMAADRG